MRKQLIVTHNKNKYFYSYKNQMFNFMPFFSAKSDVDLDSAKIDWMEKIAYFEDSPITFKIKYDSDRIKMNLANLRQLLIEVTDACNLQCKYCGYGDLYANYDKRESKKQQFNDVKLLIDSLAELWNSIYNTSYNKNVTIGFYGGEPLLNMRLIRDSIEYLESLPEMAVSFSYNMTTNAFLLDKYMDFLVEKNFSLLLSLDGNEFNSSYRVDKSGKESFHKVYTNINQLRSIYPDFFETNVNFNAVLHNRNSVEDVFSFIKHEFGKIPRVAELNTNGLSENGEKEMKEMFNNRFESFYLASDVFKSQIDIQLEDSASTLFHAFARDFSGNYFDSYNDLFDSSDHLCYIPTGTCRPFERKLFLTVNGKILPCEKIGQNHVLGFIKDGVLKLDYDEVGEYYQCLYDKIINSCKSCFLQKACGQCMFLLEEKDGKLFCPNYMGKNRASEFFSQYLSYAEDHPHLYETLMKNTAID